MQRKKKIETGKKMRGDMIRAVSNVYIPKAS